MLECLGGPTPGESGCRRRLHACVLQILAALPVDWRGTHLLACSCLRVVFIPLFILCVYPSGAPALRHPAWPCVFSLLMGISNGYFGSVPMILAAGKVSPKQRELAGEPGVVFCYPQLAIQWVNLMGIRERDRGFISL